MDNPIQSAPTQSLDLASVQSTLTCLREIMDAGDGREANAFMWAVINNLWTAIRSAPNPILSTHYPTKLVGQHLLCWVKEFLAYNMSPPLQYFIVASANETQRVYKTCHSHMRCTDIIVYESYSIKTANNVLIKQVVLFLDPNWFRRMTPFMCAEFARIRDINNFRKVCTFEHVYMGELGLEGIYSAVLMPVLKVISNGSIVSDWEACLNSGMADEWESEDEGEEEGISAVDLQSAHLMSAEIDLVLWSPVWRQPLCKASRHLSSGKSTHSSGNIAAQASKRMWCITPPSDVTYPLSLANFGLLPATWCHLMQTPALATWKMIEEMVVKEEQVVKEVEDTPATQAVHTLIWEDKAEIEKERVHVEEEARNREIATGKKKGETGYTRTGWPTGLNQWLRQGKSQPTMHEKMLELVEEGLLEGKNATLPSSNHLPATSPSGQQEAGLSSIPSVTDFLAAYTLFSSRPQQARPPPGHDPIANFAFNLLEQCHKGMTHPREAAWDRILASTHQLIASHRVLEYKLRRHSPFTTEEIEYLLQTCYPDSLHPEDVIEESRQGNRDA
ncbi:hypothetical protein EV421DRAFT_1907236 [Armillaria borealis]|uniref:Uncharacterized protein n=1 Tax=Armillaria borealis TaxID=47425 RepID=A0AA39JB64_9AGAR|nr:hypothetical protein EV421DRAFT_1907236 [Armillaria borealis]